MRMRKKKNLVPRMDRCDDLWIREPEAYKGKWRTLLRDGCELRLELGCGKGRFTCESARLEPEVLFIAVERVPDAMVIAMERAEEMELRNVFFVDADAARLPEYFEPGEVDQIYLNFSDPWPSNRHAKWRLTPPAFWANTRRFCGTGERSTSRRTTGTCLSGRCSSSPKAALTWSR